jgi:hypothetical protein
MGYFRYPFFVQNAHRLNFRAGDDPKIMLIQKDCVANSGPQQGAYLAQHLRLV